MYSKTRLYFKFMLFSFGLFLKDELSVLLLSLNLKNVLFLLLNIYRELDKTGKMSQIVNSLPAK